MLNLGPLRLHWSLLLGGALFCALQPQPWLLAGYAAVLAAHILGHAVALIGTDLHASGVMVHGIGGELTGRGEATPVRRSVIAAAGVLAQLVLLLAALAFRHELPGALADALTRRNGLMLLLNLVPLKPLDGALLWRLPGRLRAARRSRPLDPPVPRGVRSEVRDLLEEIRGSTKVR